MNLKIGVIKGDGIGPEIVTEAMKVLDKVAKRYGHNIEYRQLLMGGASIDVHGVPLTDETVAEAKSCDAVLMGSIGGNTFTFNMDAWETDHIRITAYPTELLPSAAVIAMVS